MTNRHTIEIYTRTTNTEGEMVRDKQIYRTTVPMQNALEIAAEMVRTIQRAGIEVYGVEVTPE